jgi:hypothetical protein
MGHHKHVPRHAFTGAVSTLSGKARAVIVTTMAGSAVAGGFALSGAAANAATATPLPVTLSHYVPSSGPSDGSNAAFDAKGDVQLTVGSTTASTYGQMAVNLAAAGYAEPASPPSFTTDNYAAGSPRWVVALSDGYYLFGYPAQLGTGATADFTGNQWQVNGPSTTACGASYTTYAKALACSDPAGVATVKQAYIVADGDQAAKTVDMLTSVQYNGQTLSGGGMVTVAAPGDQSSTVGTAVSLQVKAATNVSDQALRYTAGNLPTGLSIDQATGLIGGTPSGTGSFSSSVTATNAYGQSATQSFTWTVNAQVITPPSGFVKATQLTNPPLVLDDPGYSQYPGVKLQVWTQGGVPGSNGYARNQTFTVVSLPGGNVALQVAGTNMCADVRNFGTTDGTRVQLWTCGAAGYADQAWKALSTGELEAVRATSVSGVTMVLDDPLRGGNGTQLQIWSRNGFPQQQWAIPT